MTFSNNMRESISNTNEGDIKEIFLFTKVHKDQVSIMKLLACIEETLKSNASKTLIKNVVEDVSDETIDSSPNYIKLETPRLISVYMHHNIISMFVCYKLWKTLFK